MSPPDQKAPYNLNCYHLLLNISIKYKESGNNSHLSSLIFKATYSLKKQNKTKTTHVIPTRIFRK